MQKLDSYAVLGAVLILALNSSPALAATTPFGGAGANGLTGGGDLGGVGNILRTFTDFARGPLAFNVSVLGLTVAAAVLIFGGDIGMFVQRIFLTIGGIAFIALATNIISALFSSGAGF